MIDSKQNKEAAVCPNEKFAEIQEKMKAFGINLTYNPELDKFSGDEFLPEKHKEDEIRLANSTLPKSLSPFK